MISHLLMDLASAFLISYMIDFNKEGRFFLVIALLGYNFIAFFLQPFAGYWIDRRGNAKTMAVISILAGAFSILLIKLPFLMILVIGLANAVYHASGGSIVLRLDTGKSVYAGLFVSTGTLGLFMGYLLSDSGIFCFIPVFILMVIMACLIHLGDETPRYEKETHGGKRFYLTTAFLLTVITLRGLVGGYLIFEWKQGLIMTLFATLAVFLGKAAGGWISDRFGIVRTGIFALLLSAPLLVIFKSSVLLSLAGLILFNFSMPVTLFLLSRNLRGYEGFAFGTTAFFLMAGSLLSYTGITLSGAFLFALICLSGLLLYMYDVLQRREEMK